MIEDSSSTKQNAESLLAQLALGNIEESEKLMQQLLSASDSSLKVYLSEDDWTLILKIVRESFPDFSADIILDYNSVIKLNQCIDRLPVAVHDIIRLTFLKKYNILEMPTESEE